MSDPQARGGEQDIDPVSGLPVRSARLIASLASESYLQRFNMGPMDKPSLILKELPSTNNAYRAAMVALVKGLERELPRTPTTGGIFGADALTGGYEKLHCVAGCSMDPRGTPTGVQDDDVPVAWQTTPLEGECTDEEVFRMLARLMTNQIMPSGIVVRRESSSGHPHYTRDTEIKADIINHALNVWDEPSVARALRRSDGTDRSLVQAKELWREGLFLTSDVARRQQPERRDKARPVRDFSGRYGVARKTFSASELARLGAEGPAWSLASRVRERIAWAVSLTINATLIGLFASIRDAAYLVYPFTLKHGSGTEMEAAAPSHLPWPVSADVKNFDQHQPGFMIAAFIDELPFNDVIKNAMRALVRCPAFIGEDRLGHRGARWLADPADPASYRFSHGNISGWATNDVLNGVVGVFVSIQLFRAAGVLKLRRGQLATQLATFLRGKHPSCGVWNKGDDAVNWLSSEAERARVARVIAKPTPVERAHTYFTIETDDGVKFLGHVLARQGNKLVFLPDLTSYLVNFLVPEYSAGSRERPYAAFGYQQRQGYFSRHPGYPVARSLLEQACRKHLGITMADLAMAELVQPPADVDMYNYATATFITNPASIHYKINYRDLPQSLRDQFFVHFEKETVWPRLQRLLSPEAHVLSDLDVRDLRALNQRKEKEMTND